jgi:adenylate cyclase class 2
MALEIELKTRIDEPDRVKTRLNRLGIYKCEYEKEDVYWFFAPKAAGTASRPLREPGNSPSLPPSGLRIRRETALFPGGRTAARTLITYKFREIQVGIETNDEREFEVSRAEMFEDLLRRLGLEPGISKHKRGWAWYCGEDSGNGAAADRGIRAELSEVRHLGWYLELEILIPEGEKKAAGERKRLFSLLEALEIPRNAIESRPYTEMLTALGQILPGLEKTGKKIHT